ncbi:hypothetical protein N7478_011530 [Penicillium angulare]|uniref:uncharacterized protein n=1 Tax=Penicillium angulare TaxID=116970 RepID=UPI0025406B3A|nr:uncharacterized protein N7478_011530 [Penicillium angulare]KAJ5263925.1 hypothetical protein N7478_011530 [Penicillium angulare]
MASLSKVYFLSASTSATAFLYQTRTLMPLCRSLSPCHQRRYKYSTGGDGTQNSNSDDISTANPNNTTENTSEQAPANPPKRTSYLRQRGSSAPKIEPTKLKSSKSQAFSKIQSNTITRNEREAFGVLLARLKAGQEDNLKSEQERQQVTQQDSRPGPELSAPSPEGGNLTDLMTVFESILTNERAGSKEPKAKESRKGQKSTHRNRSQDGHVDELEGISLSELGLPGSDISNGVDPKVSVSEAIDMIVERESREIESELFRVIGEGKGDSGLWEACRQRIFSMIDHVGAGAPAPTNNLDSHSHGLVEQPQTPAPVSGPLNIPAAVPTGLVVAKLYPQLLLLAFRMLSTHFPESQIIGQFRTAVKEHSRTSAFLGTSQTLYEELMAFYWHSCNDLPVVVAFLRDMDNAGLYPSRRIRRLLGEIVKQREEAMKARQQGNPDFFWDAPPIHRAFEELAGPGGWNDKFSSGKKQHRKSSISGLRE